MILQTENYLRFFLVLKEPGDKKPFTRGRRRVSLLQATGPQSFSCKYMAAIFLHFTILLFDYQLGSGGYSLCRRLYYPADFPR